MSTNDATSDKTMQVIGRKRTRRNAIKPNSVESDLLHEFSVQHQLDQIQISIVAEEGREDTEDTEGGRKKLGRLDISSDGETGEKEKDDEKAVVECDSAPV
jgi:hypothetical protein